MDERFDGSIRHKLNRARDHYVPVKTSVPFFRSDFPQQGIGAGHAHGVIRNAPSMYNGDQQRRQRNYSRTCYNAS
jgi:hypothetical protein